MYGEKAEFKMILSFCWVQGVLSGNWKSQERSLLWEDGKRFSAGCDKLLEP